MLTRSAIRLSCALTVLVPTLPIACATAGSDQAAILGGDVGDASAAADAHASDATTVDGNDTGTSITSDGSNADAGSADAASESAADADAAMDAADGDADTDASDAPSDGSWDGGTCPPLGGLRPPAGTTATGNKEYEAASHALDCITSTAWNAGANTGTLTLTFPSPVAISGVQILGSARPTTTETYTIEGTVSGSSVGQIGHASPLVDNTTPAQIPITPGSYDGLKITVNGGSSWVAIVEITLIPL